MWNLKYLRRYNFGRHSIFFLAKNVKKSGPKNLKKKFFLYISTKFVTNLRTFLQRKTTIKHSKMNIYGGQSLVGVKKRKKTKKRSKFCKIRG